MVVSCGTTDGTKAGPELGYYEDKYEIESITEEEEGGEEEEKEGDSPEDKRSRRSGKSGKSGQAKQQSEKLSQSPQSQHFVDQMDEVSPNKDADLEVSFGTDQQNRLYKSQA